MGIFIKLTVSMGAYTGETVHINVDRIQSFNAVLGEVDECHPNAKSYVSLGYDDGYYVKETPEQIARAIEDAKRNTFVSFGMDVAGEFWSRGIGIR